MYIKHNVLKDNQKDIYENNYFNMLSEKKNLLKMLMKHCPAFYKMTVSKTHIN